MRRVGCLAVWARVLFFFGSVGPLEAQNPYETPYTFTTWAGFEEGYADGIGAAARFRFSDLSGVPSGVAVDKSGNVFVSDTDNQVIRKITPAGIVSTFAGSAGRPGFADGAASVATFTSPTGLAIDATGNLYVADTGNEIIRKISPAGEVTTLAGKPRQSGFGDGIGGAAQFDDPISVAVDARGNVYVAEYGNNAIRKITASGMVTTFAGPDRSGGPSDGTGREARFIRPTGVAVDGNGNVFVADYLDEAIRKITPDGVVTTFAGAIGDPGSSDGTGGTARFARPVNVAVDGEGNVIVTDNGNKMLRRISPTGVVTTLAGLTGQLGYADGTGSAVRFGSLNGIAVDRAGNLYVADSLTSTLRRTYIRKGMPTVAPLSVARLINLSVRKAIVPDVLTTGFVVRGTTAKPILIRAVGPGLQQFGVTNPVAAPALTLFRNVDGRVEGVAENRTGWGGNPAFVTAFAQVGAFPLTPADGAVLQTLAAGEYSAQVSSFGTRGDVLMELYDTDPRNADARLANLSVLATAGAGAEMLSAGFVIGGGSVRVLIRAVGPGLAQFGVSGLLTAPTLTVFSGNTSIATNSGWSGAELAAAFTKVGAFALPANSADAALLLTLPSGNYTALVSAAPGAAGTVLFEIYDVPVP